MIPHDLIPLVIEADSSRLHKNGDSMNEIILNVSQKCPHLLNDVSAPRIF